MTPVRTRLPSERNAIVKRFKIAGKSGYIIAGMYPDGKLGEVFVEMDGEGTTLGGLVNSLAIITSVALQYGVPIEGLAHKMMRQEFEPRGFTGDEEIKSAKSVVDFVFHWLLLRFGYRELNEVGPSGVPALPANIISGPDINPPVSPEVSTPVPSMAGHAAIDNHIKITGLDSCPNCGKYTMVQTGTCKTCNNCLFFRRRLWMIKFIAFCLFILGALLACNQSSDGEATTLYRAQCYLANVSGKFIYGGLIKSWTLNPTDYSYTFVERNNKTTILTSPKDGQIVCVISVW